jgi:uncharacterized protein with ParB-like and HNH nuclease domain
MAEIDAKKRTLKDILYHEYFYQVPDYQRPYSWNKENISELIDDLTLAYRNNYSEEYFCGSLVLVKDKNGNEDIRYDVIDGQQRLTTFTILSCVIRDCYTDRLDQKSKNYITRAIQDEYEVSKRKLKFLTSDQMQIEYEKTILEGIKFEKNDINPEKVFPDKKYLQNAHYIKFFLQEKLSEYGIDPNDFIKWVFEKVILTVVITEDIDNAIRIFNVLNNRGLPLSPMDILKSSLMQKLSDEDRRAFKRKWEDTANLFKSIEWTTFEDMLNTYLYFKLAANPQNRYDKELLIIFKNEKKTPLDAIYEISEFSNAYIEAIDDEDKHIYMLRYLKHRIYWHSIIATAKYVKYEKYNELLKILVAYYYQNWISGATIARIKQTSFNIIKLVKEKTSIEGIKQECNRNLNNYKTTESYKSELQGNIYDRGWDKPLLLLIEYFSKDNSEMNFIRLSNTLQIEHILPQKPEDKEWEELFDKEERNTLTDCIGNLTLLSGRKNIQASNRIFSLKKETYKLKDGVTTSFVITQKISEHSVWDKNAVGNRKKELIDFIEKHLDIF